MQLVSCRAIVAACVAVLLAGGNVAFARPSHHHHSAHRSIHHHHQHYARHGHAHVREYAEASITNQYYSGPGAAKEYAFSGESDSSVRWRGTRTHHRRIVRASAASYAGASSSGIGGGSIVADARRYLGTNPTGRRSLWCGAFMDKVLRETGHRGGGNLAKGYLHYGQRVSGPQVGAIAVMGRRGGGHVGVVSGIDERGNPIIISGNHNRTVAESVYPRSRILAYVMPGT